MESGGEAGCDPDWFSARWPSQQAPPTDFWRELQTEQEQFLVEDNIISADFTLFRLKQEMWLLVQL